MDAQQFVAEFGHIANAPGGVARLRDLILSLAFKGDLCARSADSADDLLVDMRRQRELADNETRTQRNVRNGMETSSVTGPYDIPSNWRWVSLSAVGHTWGQTKPTKPFSYIDVSSIDNKAGVISPRVEIVAAAAAPSRARKIVKSGTLIYSTIRPYLLNIAIVDRAIDPEPIASTAFAVVHPWSGVHARFVYHYLRSPYFIRYVESVQTGMAYPAISDEKFYSGSLPLPPSEEQARIVAKVDELMALCDQLAAQQQARESRKTVLAQALLTRFAEEPTQANLHSLFHSSRAITTVDLRKAILALAVQGRIVQQNHNDPFTDAQLHLFSKIQKNESDDIGDPPFELPHGWTWLRVASAFEVAGGIQKTPHRAPKNHAYPYMGVANVYRGRLDLTAVKKFELEPGELERRRLEAGDLLIIEGNGSLNEIGRCAKWNGEIRDCVHQNHVIRCRPVDAGISDFTLLYLNSPFGTEIMQRLAITGAGLYSLSVGKIRRIEMPLPPIDEQRRIVAKVGQLMALVDKLESQFTVVSTVGKRFVESVVSTLTGITTSETQDLTVKAPPTELIATLRLGTLPDRHQQAPLATELARHQGTMAVRDLWQRFGGDIDAFYSQLKIEVTKGWIQEPSGAEVRLKAPATADA